MDLREIGYEDVSSSGGDSEESFHIRECLDQMNNYHLVKTRRLKHYNMFN
jgi:hypothetical protein